MIRIENTRWQYALLSLAWVTWLILVIWSSLHHELWRDEVRALSLALEPDWWWELPLALHNEGHPVVWYLLLRWAHMVVGRPEVLQVVSIAVTAIGLAIWFAKAPYTWWIRLGFPFGVLPLYTYTVFARNYGISMLLLFLLAWLHQHRSPWQPVWLGLTLIALANTNAHSCLLAGVYLGIWCVQAARERWQQRLSHSPFVLFGIWGLVLLGLAGAYWTIRPDSTVIITGASHVTWNAIWPALQNNLLHPGTGFGAIFPYLPEPGRDLLIWVLVLGLWHKPLFGVALYTSGVGLGTFFEVVYSGALRHQGIWWIWVLTLYWMAYPQWNALSRQRWQLAGNWLTRIVIYLVIPGMMVIHAEKGFRNLRHDYHTTLSSSQAFGQWIDEHPEYQAAILIGEPDYLIESLPYYIPNLIYIPREQRYGKRVLFTTASKASMSLGELLKQVRQLHESTGKPVLFLLGHLQALKHTQQTIVDSDTEVSRDDLTTPPPFEVHYSYNKRFTWHATDLQELAQLAHQVAVFNQADSDENYAVYQYPRILSP